MSRCLTCRIWINAGSSGLRLEAHRQRGEGDVDVGVADPVVPGQRLHRGGDVGGPGPGGQQHLPDPKAEVQRQVQRSRLGHASLQSAVRCRDVVRCGGCGSTSAAPRGRPSASSGSSRSSTRRPATCATRRPSCSPRPSPGWPDPAPAAQGAAAQHRRGGHRRLRQRRRGGGRAPAARSRPSSRWPTSSASTCTAAARTRSPSWTAQQLTAGHRYEELINRTQWWGRQMLIWGVHVHVGMPEQERVMPVLSRCSTTTRTCRRCRPPPRSGRAPTPGTPPTGR